MKRRYRRLPGKRVVVPRLRPPRQADAFALGMFVVFVVGAAMLYIVLHWNP